MDQIILFWNDTLHVSDGLSVHHQEFKTVHTGTGICQTDTAVCFLANRHQYLFGCCMYSLELLMMKQAVSSICSPYACCCMYSLEFLMMDGETVRNMWSVTQNKINLIHWSISLVLL